MSTSAMHVAKTGLTAQQYKMQVIANNLANVNTTGFKRDRVNFESLLYQVSRASGEQTSADTELASAFAIGTGVRIVNTEKMYQEKQIERHYLVSFRPLVGSRLSAVERHKLRLGGARIKLAGQNCQGSIFVQPQVFNARRFSGSVQNATGHATNLETQLTLTFGCCLKQQPQGHVAATFRYVVDKFSAL